VLAPALRQRLTALLGAPADIAPVAGGDINAAFRWRNAQGARYFVKCNATLGAAAFAAEADGLARLAATASVAVPEPVAHGEAGGEGYLVLPWFDAEAGSPQAWSALGRALAALHAHTAPAYGLATDNLMGRLAQANHPHASWPRFWAAERLGAQLRLARDGGRLEARLARCLEALCEESERLCARPGLQPALLHGDLWSGNVVFTRGRPVLIDPAVYYGDREVELAFTELFGGFPREFYAAYEAAAPLDAGYGRRRAFWQLYPLLVHLNLFGAAYLGGVERAVRACEELA
jgi:fructosamine-3-kinase